MTDSASDQWACAPRIDDVRDAAAALGGVAIRTPLLENPDVNAMLSARLLIKAETAQRTGAFKFRGAYNRMRQLTDDQKARGVIACSSGNHAQAVALAARLLGTTALIVMPADAPRTKMARTRELGAEIVTYDRAAETREAVAERVHAACDRVMTPPNEDLRVLAGAGTVALEVLEQGAAPDMILTPCGGGGLTAASAIVMAALSPATRVFGVEPEDFDDTARSLKAGRRLANPRGRTTICDAIMTDIPGALTFPINQRLLAGALTVSDDEARMAMAFAFTHFNVVIEPGAAVGLAAVLAGRVDVAGRTVAVVATGGNVDADAYCAALRRAPGFSGDGR